MGAKPGESGRRRLECNERAHLTRISHHLTAEARHRPAIASLRLLAVLTVLFKYTSARQPARASH